MRNPSEIKIGQVTLQEVLKDHEMWLFGSGGKRASLQDANLQDANLQGAYLQDAYLRGANLQGAYLRDAYLRGASLRGANLQDADLQDADLRDADLRDAKNIMPIACPEKGGFTGFKKLKKKLIAELYIPSKALRVSATTRKCRASEAKVIAIYSGDKKVNEGYSKYENDFIYKVGEKVNPTKPFDTNRWNECASGIHFFVTRQEAEEY